MFVKSSFILNKPFIEDGAEGVRVDFAEKVFYAVVAGWFVITLLAWWKPDPFALLLG